MPIYNTISMLEETAIPRNVVNQVTDGMNTVSGLITENLKAEALNQLEKILAEQKKLSDVPSDVKALIELYNSETSYLNQAATWYGTKAWYEKIGLNLLIVSFSALTGAIINLAALFTLLSASLCYSISYLLIEHHEMIKSRTVLICQDILKMEKKIDASLLILEQIASQLNEILLFLWQKNIELTQEIETFNDQLIILTKKSQEYIDTIQQLEKTKDDLLKENAAILSELKEANKASVQASTNIMNQSDTLNTVNDKLNTTQGDLSQGVKTLQNLSDGFKNNLNSITHLKTCLEDRLSPKKSSSDSTSININKILEQSNHFLSNMPINHSGNQLADNEKLALKNRVARVLDSTIEQTKKSMVPH